MSPKLDFISKTCFKTRSHSISVSTATHRLKEWKDKAYWPGPRNNWWHSIVFSTHWQLTGDEFFTWGIHLCTISRCYELFFRGKKDEFFRADWPFLYFHSLSGLKDPAPPETKISHGVWTILKVPVNLFSECFPCFWWSQLTKGQKPPKLCISTHFYLLPGGIAFSDSGWKGKPFFPPKNDLFVFRA